MCNGTEELTAINLGSNLHADCCVEDTLSSEQCWERVKDDKAQQFCHSVKTIITDNKYCQASSDCNSGTAPCCHSLSETNNEFFADQTRPAWLQCCPKIT